MRSRTSTWFETKVKYQKMMEDGMDDACEAACDSTCARNKCSRGKNLCITD